MNPPNDLTLDLLLHEWRRNLQQHHGISEPLQQESARPAVSFEPPSASNIVSTALSKPAANALALALVGHPTCLLGLQVRAPDLLKRYRRS